MSPAKSLFITATDTGVGKTLVSGLLLNYLLRGGVKAGYQKWAATGVDDGRIADLADCLKIAGLKPERELLDRQVPYRFTFPASPHLAAEMEGIEIEPEKIIADHRKMAEKYEILIVEGVGGLLVPLNRELLLADLLGRLKLSTLIVARSGLGAINHTLLSIEALRSRAIPIAGVVFTDSGDEEETIAADNMETIGAIGKVEILGRLPYCRSPEELVDRFEPIGAKISRILANA